MSSDKRGFYKINLVDIVLIVIFTAVLLFLRAILLSGCSRIQEADVAIRLPEGFSKGVIVKHIGDNERIIVYYDNNCQTVLGIPKTCVRYEVSNKKGKIVVRGNLSDDDMAGNDFILIKGVR